MRDQHIDSAIARCFQDHLVVRVRQLRPPLNTHFHRLARASQSGKEAVDVAQFQSMREALLWMPDRISALIIREILEQQIRATQNLTTIADQENL